MDSELHHGRREAARELDHAQDDVDADAEVGTGGVGGAETTPAAANANPDAPLPKKKLEQFELPLSVQNSLMFGRAKVRELNPPQAFVEMMVRHMNAERLRRPIDSPATVRGGGVPPGFDESGRRIRAADEAEEEDADDGRKPLPERDVDKDEETAEEAAARLDELMRKGRKNKTIVMIKDLVNQRAMRRFEAGNVTTTTGIGRRKAASAFAEIQLGTGQCLVVNRSRTLVEYLKEEQVTDVLSPLMVLDQLGRFDVKFWVGGGGLSGQTGAMRLALARALQDWNFEFREPLKKFGFLTRDARVVERKKPGQRKARAKFAFVKR